MKRQWIPFSKSYYANYLSVVCMNPIASNETIFDMKPHKGIEFFGISSVSV